MLSGGCISEWLTSADDAVAALLRAPTSQMSDDELLAAMRRVESVARKLQALSTMHIVDATERTVHRSLGHRSVNQLLVSMLRISDHDASRRIAAAKNTGTWHTPPGEETAPTLVDAAAAQREGDISNDHIGAIDDVAERIPHSVPREHREAAVDILASLARHAPPQDVKKAGEELLARLDPDGTITDDRDRKRRRGITLGAQKADLMSYLSGWIDPTLRALLEPVLEKWARPGMNNPDDPESPSGPGDEPEGEPGGEPGAGDDGGNSGDGGSGDRGSGNQVGKASDAYNARKEAARRDTRSVRQRNHDALLALCRAVAARGDLGTHRGLPATTIIMMTLAQLERAAGGHATTASGGVLPIPEALALAEKSHPVLALFDHNGRPLHIGRKLRLANADQRLALYAASRGCTRPGCRAPATRTQVHHLHEWNKNGRTDIEHLDLACDACHALIHDGPGGWKTETAPPGHPYAGHTLWTAPEHIDPTRTPRINHSHHGERLLAEEVRRREAERAHEPTQNRPGNRSSGDRSSGDGAGGEGAGGAGSDDVP